MSKIKKGPVFKVIIVDLMKQTGIKELAKMLNDGYDSWSEMVSGNRAIFILKKD